MVLCINYIYIVLNILKNNSQLFYIIINIKILTLLYFINYVFLTLHIQVYVKFLTILLYAVHWL